MPFPIIAGLQAGAGILQSLIGSGKAKKAQRELENLQTPTYISNKGILDYYNQALNRYNVSPTDSAMYKRQNNNINRGVANSLSALQDRRSGLAGTSSILRAANDARLNTEVAAEQERNRRFGELGNATQLKAGEDRMAFQQNELAPFEKKYNLLSMKAGAANQTVNAGLSNIFGGLQNVNNTSILNKMYGTPNTKKGKASAPGAGYAPDFDNYNQPQ